MTKEFLPVPFSAKKLSLEEVTLSLKNLTKQASPFRSIKNRSPFVERRTKDLIEDGKSEKSHTGRSKGKRGVVKSIKHIKPEFLKKTLGSQSNRGSSIPRDVKCYEVNSVDIPGMQKRSSLNEDGKTTSPMLPGLVPNSISMPTLSPNTGSISTGIDLLSQGTSSAENGLVGRPIRSTYSAEDILNGVRDESDGASTSSITADPLDENNPLLEAILNPKGGGSEVTRENIALLEADDIDISLLEYTGLTDGAGQRRSARLSFLQNGNPSEDQILNSLSKYLQKQMTMSEANLRQAELEMEAKEREAKSVSREENVQSSTKQTENGVGAANDSEEVFDDLAINGITLDDEEEENAAISANENVQSTLNDNGSHSNLGDRTGVSVHGESAHTNGSIKVENVSRQDGASVATLPAASASVAGASAMVLDGESSCNPEVCGETSSQDEIVLDQPESNGNGQTAPVVVTDIEPTKQKKQKGHKHKKGHHEHKHSTGGVGSCAGCFSFIHSSASPSTSFTEPCLVKPVLPLESSTSTSSSSVNAVGQSNSASSVGSQDSSTNTDEMKPTDGERYIHYS